MMSAEIGKQILEAIKAYVAGHIASVTARIDQLANALEELHTAVRSMPPPQRGEKGADGRTPTEAELRALIEPLIPAAVPGDPGPTGERGEKGDSPTDEQLLALIRPLIPAPVRGERGEPGERGERGVRGADGRTPTEAELRALIVPLIPAPVPGEKGERGSDGTNGRDGLNGRDALQLEVLPAIDEARSYPRGMYARHAGGLWRSFETTHAMRGWECIVDGIAEESETLLEDGRTLVRRTVYSSGRTFERSIHMAVMLDRGVYKADSEYAPGDAVTWAGSVWIAQPRDRGTPYGKPSTPGSGWRLAVKAGRDARS